MKNILLAAAAALILASCSSDQQVQKPVAVALSPDDLSHYSQMVVIGHAGPKAQVHLAGVSEPLWFTQVRDALAYDRMPEESAEVTAIYVSDMAMAPSWDDPGVDNWIDITTAVFVEGSERRGGMGAPELVPFSNEADAQVFAASFGGRIIGFDAIDDDMVLAPVEVEQRPDSDDEPADDMKVHKGMEMPS